jgi:hypothetical protein
VQHDRHVVPAQRLDAAGQLQPPPVQLGPPALCTAATTSAAVTEPNSRPPVPARAGSVTVIFSRSRLISWAWPRSRTSRASRARLIVATCFSPPLVQASRSRAGRGSCARTRP